MHKNQLKKNSGGGCLWIFLAFVFTIIAFGVVQLFGIPEIISIVIALLIGIFITYKILGKPIRSSIIKSLLFLLFAFYILKIVGGFFMDNILTERPKEGPFVIEESVIKTSIIENNDTVPVYTSNRYWRDNYGNDYSGKLTVRNRTTND